MKEDRKVRRVRRRNEEGEKGGKEESEENENNRRERGKYIDLCLENKANIPYQKLDRLK